MTVAVAVLAFLLGRQHHSSTVTAIGPGIADATQGGGTAYVGAGEPLNRQPFGFAYALPQDLPWTDASGGEHFSSHPPCLPIARAVRVQKIEAVRFTDPSGTGTVLWVQC